VKYPLAYALIKIIVLGVIFGLFVCLIESDPGRRGDLLQTAFIGAIAVSVFSREVE
jgi:hypothetical protein